MKLETRLLLVIGAILLAVFAGDATLAYRRAHHDALEDLERQSEKIRAVVMATRRVYQRNLVASGIEWTDRTLPLLPAHAMTEISKDFGRWDDSGVSFNNVSDRPRNPANRADAVEMEAIRRFRAAPELEKVVLPFEPRGGEPHYLYARPIRVEGFCLECHGDRDQAPAVIRTRYAEAYGYQIGELRGILSIKMPASHVRAVALASLPSQLGAHLAGLVMAFLGIGFLIRRHVRQPLTALAAGMRAVAAGDYSRRIGGLDGEFADLAATFNAMAAQIPLHHEEIRRLSAAVEQSPASVVMTDTRGRIVYVNRRFTEVTGYTADEAIGRPPSLLKSGRMNPGIYAALWATITGGGEWRGELLNRRKDGALFWERASISPVRGADGSTTLYLAVKEDVTAQKEAQRSARETDERLHLILESAGEGIFGMDRAGHCTFINPASLRMLGYGSADELLGRDVHALIHHSREDATRIASDACRARQAILHGHAMHVEDEVFWRKDGSSFPVEYRAHPIVQDGTVIGGVVSFTDISHRRESELLMRGMVDQLVRSNTELERFAYVASHDLQEPLRSISSYAQLLARRYHGKLDADADAFIDFMVGGTRRMQALIHDLLAYSRVQTRGGNLRPVAAEHALRSALMNLSEAIAQAGARVCVGEMPTVLADEVQLVQVFQNLVGNAVKFAPPGHPPRIDIMSRRVDGRWEITVADDGIGIAPEHHARIFDVFQRLHTTAEYPGTGIGLALVKRIVERHGGAVTVDSAPEHGAVFRFDLAAAEEAP